MRKMRAMFGGVAVAAGILFLVSAAGPASATILFDFEGEPMDGSSNGSLTSLFMTQSGLTLEITRSTGESFDVVNSGAAGFPNAYPSTWGSQALSPFFNETLEDFFIVNFSLPVFSFSLETGDFGDDNPDVVSLQAFSLVDATGTILDTDSVNWGAGDFNLSGPGDPPIELSVSSEGIRSVAFFGGTPGFSHSVFYDNLTVTLVPEPSTALLLGLGLAGLAACGRQRAH